MGRLLMETISRVPKIEGPKFESLLNSTMQVAVHHMLNIHFISTLPHTHACTRAHTHTHTQDLLMVVYLANLTKTQMVLGERLSQFKST